MNSFLQSLYATIPFRQSILNSNPNDFTNDPENLVVQLQKLFEIMKSRAQGLNFDKIDPSFLKNVVPEPFRSNKDQQDTMEFGRTLLEDLAKKLKDSPLQGFIKNLFSVEIVHSYECQECRNASKNVEECLDIPLSFCKKL